MPCLIEFQKIVFAILNKFYRWHRRCSLRFFALEELSSFMSIDKMPLKRYWNETLEKQKKNHKNLLQGSWTLSLGPIWVDVVLRVISIVFWFSFSRLHFALFYFLESLKTKSLKMISFVWFSSEQLYLIYDQNASTVSRWIFILMYFCVVEVFNCIAET